MRRAHMLSVVAEAVRLAHHPQVTVGLVRNGSRQRVVGLVRDRAIAAIHTLRHAKLIAGNEAAQSAYRRLLAAFAPDVRAEAALGAALDRAETALSAATTAFAEARALADLARANGHA